MKRVETGRGLLDLLVAISLLGVLAGMGIPLAMDWARERRLRGAVYYLRDLVRQVRAQAAARSRYMGIVFDEMDGKPELSVHIDGNGNGIRRADIGAGVDPRVRGPWKLSNQFPGVRYGTAPGGAEEPPLPGLKIGRSQILSFSPIGSSTTGTIILSNEQGLVYGVIILGATGRARLARYHKGRWQPLP